MAPDFSNSVDPVFTFVLQIMDEIESGRSPDPMDISTHVQALLGRAESALGPRKDWELAKYALVAWVDDLLIEAPWEGRDWWEQNRLEFEIFRTAEAFTVFYIKANEANKLPRKDALEVFYVAVVLGFRGLYNDPTAAAHADQFGVPRTLDEWARRTAVSIQLGQGRPDLIEQGRPATGAPPLEGKYLFIGTLITFILLAAITGFSAYWIFDYVNQKGG